MAFSRLRGFWENVLFEAEISSRTLNSTRLCQDRYTVAQRAETTVAECKRGSLRLRIWFGSTALVAAVAMPR